MMLETDKQVDGQSWIQILKTNNIHSLVPLIARLFCEQENKDIYAVSQIFVLNMVSD